MRYDGDIGSGTDNQALNPGVLLIVYAVSCGAGWEKRLGRSGLSSRVEWRRALAAALLPGAALSGPAWAVDVATARSNRDLWEGAADRLCGESFGDACFEDR